jgi:hypothetical protein
MAECKDINGNDVTQFYFGNDGVVYGVTTYQNTETNYGITLPYNGEGNLVDLSLECCTARGFTYDSNYGKCYHQVPSDEDVKIVFNVDGHNGLIFTQVGEEDCTLNLKFDYLVEYLSEDLYQRSQNFGEKISNILKELKFSVLIEKYVDVVPGDGSVIIDDNKTLIPIYQKSIYNINSYNSSSGIILGGSKKSEVTNKLRTELGVGYYSEILDSPWLQTNINISNQETINSIINEEVKFSLLVTNSVIDFSIIMDNIALDKVCTREWVETRSIDTAPSFNAVKVIDNKKSWVSGQAQRDFDLPIRETSYSITDERMVINSKEVEITTSVYDAIEQDMATFIADHIGLLEGTTGNNDYRDIDMTSIMSSNVAELDNYTNILLAMSTELVDVKSRKTLVSYPLLGMVYDRYLTSEQYLDGIASNKYSPSKLNGLVNLLGNYWVDLVEQVVPSTTIWASVNRIGTSTFIPSKFKYSRYTIKCNDEDWGVTTDLNGNEVEIISNEIGDETGEREVCTNLRISNYSDSSTSVGSVSITGTTGTYNTTINEG